MNCNPSDVHLSVKPLKQIKTKNHLSHPPHYRSYHTHPVYDNIYIYIYIRHIYVLFFKAVCKYDITFVILYFRGRLKFVRHNNMISSRYIQYYVEVLHDIRIAEVCNIFMVVCGFNAADIDQPGALSRKSLQVEHI